MAITQLGVYVGPGGLVAPLHAAIFDSATQAVLAGPITFTPGETGLLAVGGYVYLPLATPLHLAVGTTAVVGAWGYGTQSGGGPQRFGNAGSSTTTPWALETDDLFVPLGSLLGSESSPGAFPTLLDGPSPNKYAAGTFMFADDSLTSDPAVFGSADTYKLVYRDFLVQPKYSVSGSIQLPTLPGSASPVLTLHAGDKVIGSTSAANDGTFVFSGITPGTYMLSQQVPTGLRDPAPPLAVQSFATAQLVNLGPDNAGAQALAATTADLTGDGKLDLAAALSDPATGTARLVVSAGNGDDTFATPYYSSTLSGIPLKIVAFDGTGDGRLDLAVLYTNGNVDVFDNLGGGSFQAAPNYFSLATAVAPGQTPVDLVAGDFNHNGARDFQDDLVVAYKSGTGPGGFVIAWTGGAPQNYPLTQAPGGLAATDVNRDGNLDLLINEGTQLEIAYSNGLTTAFHFQTVPTDLVGAGGPVAVADFNGDGRPDIVLQDSNGQVELFLQNIGSFVGSVLQNVPVTSNGLGVTVADFNGDGQPDLALLRDDGSLLLFVNHGPAGLNAGEQPVLLSVPSGLVGLSASADFTNDGRPDLLFVSGQGVYLEADQVSLQENAVSFTLTAGGQLTNFEPPQLGAQLTLTPDATTPAPINLVDVATGSIAGIVYDDLNRNDTRDAGDLGLAGVRVFLDVNHDGSFDPTVDPSALTDANGAFTFTAIQGPNGTLVPLPDGDYQVGVIAGPDWVESGTSTLRTEQVKSGQGTPNADFGLSTPLVQQLADPAELTVGDTLTFRVKPALPDAAATLFFQLAPGAPAGASIDPATGQFTFIPQPTERGKQFPVTIVASDPFDPARHESQTIVLAVSGTVTPIDQRLISAVYESLLGRPADATGLDFWEAQMEQGSSLRDVARFIAGSQEHQTNVVQNLYQSLLRRPADAAGLAFYVAALQAGATDESVQAALLGSGEYFQNVGGDTTNGFLAALYQDLLSRPLDPAGHAFFEQVLSAPGAGRITVAQVVLQSDEYRQDVVRQLYIHFLSRAADPQGRAFFVAALENGARDEDVIATLIATQEMLGANTQLVSQIYRDLLGRPAQTAEVGIWLAALDGGASPTTVAGGIVDSSEYQTRQVEEMYTTLLHRPGDAAGVAAFVGELVGGATVEQVEAEIIASPEYFQTRGQGGASGFLDSVYQDVLNRPVDSGGLAAFTALAADGADGRLQVIDALFTATEYRQDLVQSYYQRLLHRAADTAGLDFYVAELSNGTRDEQVLASLIGSREYLALLPGASTQPSA
jgi:hypothetical protein